MSSPQNDFFSSTTHHWPGDIEPRYVAAKAIEEITKSKPKTAEETWAIFDDVVAAYPGCAVEIVRTHVGRELELRRAKRTGERPNKPRFSVKLTGEERKGNCKGCGRPILWHKTKKGKWMPLDDPGGFPHWDTCPNAADFKSKNRG